MSQWVKSIDFVTLNTRVIMKNLQQWRKPHICKEFWKIQTENVIYCQENDIFGYDTTLFKFSRRFSKLTVSNKIFLIVTVTSVHYISSSNTLRNSMCHSEYTILTNTTFMHTYANYSNPNWICGFFSVQQKRDNTAHQLKNENIVSSKSQQIKTITNLCVKIIKY